MSNIISLLWGGGGGGRRGEAAKLAGNPNPCSQLHVVFASLTAAFQICYNAPVFHSFR